MLLSSSLLGERATFRREAATTRTPRLHDGQARADDASTAAAGAAGFSSPATDGGTDGLREGTVGGRAGVWRTGVDLRSRLLARILPELLYANMLSKT